MQSKKWSGVLDFLFSLPRTTSSTLPMSGSFFFLGSSFNPPFFNPDRYDFVVWGLNQTLGLSIWKAMFCALEKTCMDFNKAPWSPAQHFCQKSECFFFPLEPFVWVSLTLKETPYTHWIHCCETEISLTSLTCLMCFCASLWMCIR